MKLLQFRLREDVENEGYTEYESMVLGSSFSMFLLNV